MVSTMVFPVSKILRVIREKCWIGILHPSPEYHMSMTYKENH